MFSAAIDALSAGLDAADGCTVSYHRGAEVKTVTARRGKTEIEEADKSGAMTKTQSVDWFIQTASLPFGLPKRGDRIDADDFAVAGSGPDRYEVMPLNGQFYRFCDHGQRLVRIHTKKTKV